jgi:hypothetical protein
MEDVMKAKVPQVPEQIDLLGKEIEEFTNDIEILLERLRPVYFDVPSTNNDPELDKSGDVQLAPLAVNIYNFRVRIEKIHKDILYNLERLEI